jgi:hypothetical protein
MNLIKIIKNLLIHKIKIDVKKLPSQGFFYNDDFEIYIKKVDIEDIKEYENGYDRENLSVVLKKLKKIVEKNVILSKKYTYGHIKSIDIVFLFLEIVKLTRNKEIKIEYYNDVKSKNEFIDFDSKNFNYYKVSDELFDKWNEKERLFDINGYKYSLPSIGIENCLTMYLISKSYEEDAIKYNEYNYDFTFFLGNRESVNFNEIENLIQIFNFDIEEDEYKKIEYVIRLLNPIQKYSLKKGDKIIDMNSKINLEKIWK